MIPYAAHTNQSHTYHYYDSMCAYARIRTQNVQCSLRLADGWSCEFTANSSAYALRPWLRVKLQWPLVFVAQQRSGISINRRAISLPSFVCLVCTRNRATALVQTHNIHRVADVVAALRTTHVVHPSSLVPFVFASLSLSAA